jgi:hypothetical protein
VQRCPRGSEHDDLAHEELGHDRGDSLKMLEVVEHEQHPSRGEPVGDVVVGLQPDRLGDGRPHRVGVAQRGEGDEERPVEELVGQLRRGLQRQPGLPRPARPGQGQQPHAAGHERADLRQLLLAAEQRPRRDGEVRPSQRLERREVAAAQLVDALGCEEVLEPVLPEVVQVTVDERRCLLRHEHLSAMAGCRDAGTAMNVDADVALVGEERRSGVQADAYADRTGRERLGQLGGSGERSGRRCECDEERVALGIDLHSVMTGTRLADDSPVCGECLGIGLCSQLVQELCRPLDVGEEEGDSAGRKLPMHEPKSCAARDLPSSPSLWRQDRGCPSVLSLGRARRGRGGLPCAVRGESSAGSIPAASIAARSPAAAAPQP